MKFAIIGANLQWWNTSCCNKAAQLTWTALSDGYLPQQTDLSSSWSRTSVFDDRESDLPIRPTTRTNSSAPSWAITSCSHWANSTAIRLQLVVTVGSSLYPSWSLTNCLHLVPMSRSCVPNAFEHFRIPYSDVKKLLSMSLLVGLLCFLASTLITYFSFDVEQLIHVSIAKSCIPKSTWYRILFCDAWRRLSVVFYCRHDGRTFAWFAVDAAESTRSSSRTRRLHWVWSDQRANAVQC